MGIRMKNVLQTAGHVAKNSWKYLPFGSFINCAYICGEKEYATRHPNKFVLKGFSHLAYASLATAAVLFECLGFSATGEINPITQRQVILQRLEQAEKDKSFKEKQYNDLVDKLFSPSGLADTNHDGNIDDAERVEAYKRMGLEPQFPIPLKEDLEKAVSSYSH